MVYLVVSIIKMSSKTLHTIVNDHTGDRMMLYRSEIDDDLDEILKILSITYLSFGPWKRHGAHRHE